MARGTFCLINQETPLEKELKLTSEAQAVLHLRFYERNQRYNSLIEWKKEGTPTNLAFGRLDTGKRWYRKSRTEHQKFDVARWGMNKKWASGFCVFYWRDLWDWSKKIVSQETPNTKLRFLNSWRKGAGVETRGPVFTQWEIRKWNFLLVNMFSERMGIWKLMGIIGKAFRKSEFLNLFAQQSKYEKGSQLLLK